MFALKLYLTAGQTKTEREESQQKIPFSQKELREKKLHP